MICVKKLMLMQIYDINYGQILIFRLYAVYKKSEMLKICNQPRKKLQVLEYFCNQLLLI